MCKFNKKLFLLYVLIFAMISTVPFHKIRTYFLVLYHHSKVEVLNEYVVFLHLDNGINVFKNEGMSPLLGNPYSK